MDYVVFKKKELTTPIFNILNKGSYTSIIYQGESRDYNIFIRMNIPKKYFDIVFNGNIFINNKEHAKITFLQTGILGTFFYRTYNKIPLKKDDIIDFQTITCNSLGIVKPDDYIGDFALYI